MHFPIIYARFFAPPDNRFFLLLSFLFCPSLKDDGTSELHVLKYTLLVVPKVKNRKHKPSPNTEKVSAELTEGASVRQKVRKFPREQY